MTTQKIRYSVYFSPQPADVVATLAQALEIPFTQVVSDIVEEWLQSHGYKDRETTIKILMQEARSRETAGAGKEDVDVGKKKASRRGKAEEVAEDHPDATGESDQEEAGEAGGTEEDEKR